MSSGRENPYEAQTGSVLEAAGFLASSLHFCWSVSCQLGRLKGKANSDLQQVVAQQLRELAQTDAKKLHAFTSAQGANCQPWWLLANLLLCSAISRWPLILLMVLNGFCVVAKVVIGTFSWTSTKDYMMCQLKLFVAGACLVLPLLVWNIAAWAFVHLAVRLATHLLPDLLRSLQPGLQPLPIEAFQNLSAVVFAVWIMAKFLMLVEVLGSHRYYREVLGRRRQTGLPSISFHVVDAFYGFSYTIVAFHIAWASLEQASLLQRRWLPGGWSPIGIFLSLILRGAFLPFGMKLKAAMYFSVHRLLHVQPFYTCWHKEHHFSASQTCLTACQESGLLESGAEALYVQLAFVLVPFFDHAAYLWAAINNTMNHHYYEDYKNLHWKVAKHMLLAQRMFRKHFSKLELPAWQLLDGLLAENLRFPATDFKSPQLGLGSIEKAWHARHHWTTEKRFGYGTYDSVSNLAAAARAKAKAGEAETEGESEKLEQFLKEYLQLLTGQIQTTSLVNR
ncbi:unnamed protein product [Durusdinium trenchii]|uniref:Uncharacterized protein n=2 Tax=Durusdinium trenchii TaxID=1381693 RepID=A0ABP0RNE3_9DINO